MMVDWPEELKYLPTGPFQYRIKETVVKTNKKVRDLQRIARCKRQHIINCTQKEETKVHEVFIKSAFLYVIRTTLVAVAEAAAATS